MLLAMKLHLTLMIKETMINKIGIGDYSDEEVKAEYEKG